jgi:predicted nucleic acid-binding protein
VSEVVVDTSVAFKWFVPLGEDGVDEAGRLLDAHLAGDVTIVAPASLPLELANGLRYSPAAEEDVLEFVEGFGLTHIELVELSASLLADATRLAFAHAISVYDAVFLAVALERGCPLVTADRKAFAGLACDVEIRLV